MIFSNCSHGDTVCISSRMQCYKYNSPTDKQLCDLIGQRGYCEHYRITNNVNTVPIAITKTLYLDEMASFVGEPHPLMTSLRCVGSMVAM